MQATTQTPNESSHNHLSKPNKKLSALKAKQARRKYHGTSAPDPSLSISLDVFVSFTEFVKSSTRIFALIGAGVSVASGMPTFRGEDRLWRAHEPSDLADSDVFDKDPTKVWWFFSHRMMIAQNARPNKGHMTLARLAEGKEGFFAVNQNVDGLLERAGFPGKQMAKCHGSLFSVKCSNATCGYVKDATYPVCPVLTLPTEVDISDPAVPLPTVERKDLPHCPECNHLLRPDVVLFGEAIPKPVLESIWNFQKQGPIDLMLVVGTSCVVLPASMYVQTARNSGARVAMFNIEESGEEIGHIQEGDWFLKGDAAVMVSEMLKGVVGQVRA
ncbi:putative SIR2 family histone deacetylase [Clohesyomyces aquaticus]|uniref:Putative SIR2 family histone deacetylase n=1 Tax=Clohesyomyces aquaticus TaxID=1231657 RepID=A0A1Y2A3H3_9PLEO|nr:putative SIR2 family histone deacetylase [Clohesyomyces aquaticus]